MPSSTASSSSCSSHLSRFSLLVLDLRSCLSSGRNVNNDKMTKKLEEVEKVITVLLKVSDPAPFEATPTCLLDLHWLLSLSSSKDTKSPLLWSVVSLLLRLCAKSSILRAFVRDRVRLLASLTDLWLNLPSTSKERGIKVLDLMRHAAFGMKILRQEEFLIRLLPKLVESVESSDCSEKCHSLFVLTSLVRGNHAVAKMLISLLSEQKRKMFLTAADGTGEKAEVLLEQLNFSLNQTSLSSNLASSSWDSLNIDVRLARISNAFCAAYGEEDWLQMEMLTSFLTEICASKEDRRTKIEGATLISLMQQVLLVADYSEGAASSLNESTFKFFRELFHLTVDPFPVIDLLVRALQPQLESQNVKAFQAVSLLRDLTLKVDGVQDRLDATQLQNIKLQLDPLVGSLCQIALPGKSESEGSVKTKDVVLESLIVLAGVDDWADMVSARLKHSRMRETVQDLVEAALAGETKQALLPGFILLANALAQDLMEEEEKPEIMSKEQKARVEAHFVERLKSNGCGKREAKKILLVLKETKTASEGFSSREDLETYDSELSHLPSTPTSPCSSEDVFAVQALLEKVAKDVEKQNVQGDLAEVLELGDYRLCAQNRQIENLKSSLKLADQKIAQQSEMNHLLEAEIAKMSGLMRTLCQKTAAAEQELNYVRDQHFTQQEEATLFRKKITQACAEKEDANVQLQSENEKVVAKAIKYKEKIEALQEAYKAQMANNEELQAKLKNEIKEKADMTSALEKREEKLKKKEKSLEDETKQRERLQAELDSSRKEYTLLQSLTKRQEQALIKKEKQIQELTEEQSELKKVQEQIFNLTKLRGN